MEFGYRGGVWQRPVAAHENNHDWAYPLGDQGFFAQANGC